MHNPEYTMLRTTEELRAFVPAWRALWNQDQDATPFQSPDWLLPWWHSFESSKLRAIQISENGALLGFLPFYFYPEPHTGERQLLLLGAGTTDYLNGVFTPECTIEHIQGALDVLCAEEGWDTLHASQLLPHSKLSQALERSATFTGHCFEAESGSRMAAVAIAGLPQKIRRNAMYYRNRAMRVGTLELTIANASNWPESFDALVELHTARWRQQGKPGVLSDASVLAWHREALPKLEQSGSLRLCSLRLNGEIIGVLYSLVDPPSRSRRTQYFYLTAYSTQHAELRPGTLLLALAIETAAREGVQAIDMLRGDEAYKEIWHLERYPTRGFAVNARTMTQAVSTPPDFLFEGHVSGRSLWSEIVCNLP